jgi:hypothetical protein
MAAEKKKKSKFLTIIIILIVLSALFAAGAYYILKIRKPAHSFVNINLKDEIVSFSREKLPEIYLALASLDFEIQLIDQEIERLELMGKEFQRQKQIISPEINRWKKIRQTLSASLLNLEKDIETIYVSHSVNREKGLQLIDNKRDDMLQKADNAITASKESTLRLKSKKEAGLIDKIKQMVN